MAFVARKIVLTARKKIGIFYTYPRDVQVLNVGLYRRCITLQPVTTAAYMHRFPGFLIKPASSKIDIE